MNSVTSAEALAAGEAIDQGKVPIKAFNEQLNLNIESWIGVDSKDLFSNMSTCRMAADQSICGDIRSIRLEFATKTIPIMIWVPGNTNSADPRTKTDRNISQILLLLFATSQIPFDFDEARNQSSEKLIG